MVEGALGSMKRALVGGISDKDVSISTKHEGKNYLSVKGVCTGANGNDECEMVVQEIDGQVTISVGSENRPSNLACQRKVEEYIRTLYNGLQK